MRPLDLQVERMLHPAPGHVEIVCRPGDALADLQPGQFFMLQPEGVAEALLPRAFSFYRVQPGGPISFLLHRVGPGTEGLARLRPGDRLSAFGPLGNGFPLPDRAGRAVLIGGGVGVPPLWLLAERLLASGRDVTVLVGARTADLLLGAAEFERLGATVAVATDDGSAGHLGPVTDIVPEGAAVWYACGPQAMLRRVQDLASEPSAPPAWLALEAPMGCGYGVCMGCAVERRRPDPALGEYGRYVRVCREGPVFAAQEVVL